MKNKRIFLSLLVILLTGAIYFTVQALQKNTTHRPSFAGEWKAKQSISMGGNIVCCYGSGDRMLATTMKIDEQANFLTIAVSSAFTGETPVASQEQLTFDGKATQINHDRGWQKQYTVQLSPDGQRMTVNSTVRFMTAAPYKVNVQEEMTVYTTEVWTLGNDGKSITVQTRAKSNLYDKERNWTTVFNKVI